MGRIPERVVAARIPNDVRINLDEMPKHELDNFCRVTLRCIKKAFENPEFRAGYEAWLAERKAGGSAGRDKKTK